MDTVQRAAELADSLDGYVEKDTPVSSVAQQQQLPQVSPSPFGGHPLPSTMTQAPDSQRQFYRQGGAGQQRFFNPIPVAANQSAASSQNQAERYAKWQATALTLDAIADSPTYGKVPIEQFDANGNLILANYQGAWNSATTYSAGQEVSNSGNVWVATDTNTDSEPAAGNSFWQLVGPQTMDDIANGTSYGKVSIDALNASGEIDFSGTAWVNKTLDHLPDGSTYAKVLGNALDSSGNVDLSKSGVTGKNLDNIADSTTYSRILSNLTFGGTLRSPHASTVAQISPTHWFPFEGLSGNAPLADIGTSPASMFFVNISGGGSQGISNYSLVNGDALKAGFLANYAAVFQEPSGYGTSHTIATWVYFNGSNPPSAAPICSMFNGTAGGTPSAAEVGLWVKTTGEVVYTGQFTGGSVTLVSGKLNWAVPHHLCVTVNGASVALYVDGLLATSDATTGIHDAFLTVAWGTLYNSSWLWNSNTTLQHMTIWRGTPLSTGQVAALYQAGSTGAQDMDSLRDGGTFQRVWGVTNNKTNTASYTAGSVSINVQTINAAGTSVTGTGGSKQTIETVTMPASATGAALISLSVNAQHSSGTATGITFEVYNGTTLLYTTGVNLATTDTAATSLGNMFTGVSGLLDTTVTGGTVYTVKAYNNAPSSSTGLTNILFSVLNIKA